MKNSGKYVQQLPAHKLRIRRVQKVAPMLQNATATKDLTPAKTVKKRRWATKDELIEKNKTYVPHRKLFGNYILENTTILFPSERGTGKTWLSMQIGLCITEGISEFLGEKIELHGSVIYLNMELGQEVFGQRVSKLNQGIQSGNKKGEFIVLSESVSVKDIFSELEQKIIAERPVLVIIDNLRLAVGVGFPVIWPAIS